MKNLLSLLVTLSVLFFASCSKEEVNPSEGKIDADGNIVLTSEGLPEATWDDLPADLRDAEEMSDDELKALTIPSDLWGSRTGTEFSSYCTSDMRIYAVGAKAGSIVDQFVVWYQYTSTGKVVYRIYGGTGGGSLTYIKTYGAYVKQVYRNIENFYGTQRLGGVGVRMSDGRVKQWGDKTSAGSVKEGWSSSAYVSGFYGYADRYMSSLGYFIRK